MATMRTSDEPVQFTLSQAFVVLSLLGVYFAMVRGLGQFVAALFLGLLIIVNVLRIWKFGMIGSMLAGALLAAAFVIASGVLLGTVMTAEFIVAMIVYPGIGYFVGLIFAADRQLRSGA